MDEAHDTQLCHILEIQERPRGCPAPGGQPFLLQLLGIDLAVSKLKSTDEQIYRFAFAGCRDREMVNPRWLEGANPWNWAS